jgi:hypothetical protein
MSPGVSRTLPEGDLGGKPDEIYFRGFSGD